MKKKHPWLCAGTAALALAIQPHRLLAEEPPQKEEVEVEVEVTESAQQVAEQAAEAARAIAAQAAAEAQEAAAKIAAEAAQHAEQAAHEVVKEVTKAAENAARHTGLSGVFPTAPYQVGLRVAPVSKALDTQLKLEGKGILIDVVEKDGPGEKAGLKPHDIILSVAEHDIKTTADLAKTLTESEGQELQFDVIRGGEKLTIMVQPHATLKASGNLTINVPKVEVDEEIIELESKIRQKLKDAGVDVRMHVIRPGHVIPPEALLKRGELPEGVSISVRKEGGKPATIEVTRGEEKWEVTEASLDKLPEELRPHVEHMLGRGPIGIGFPPNVKFTAPLPPGLTITTDAPGKRRVREEVAMKVAPEARRSELQSIARSLEEIKKDIHRLYDQIDELREDRKRD